MSNTEFFYRAGLLAEWQSVETCVTFSWIQLNLRLFELTGDERALDLVEEAAWNQLLPALSPQADTWSYHLAMTGPKRYFKRWVQGVGKDQARPAGAPITCCHTNGQRGLALVPQYAYTITGDGALAVNLYGMSGVQLSLPGAGQVNVEQETDYPRAGTVLLNVIPSGDAEYELRLRRPAWSPHMTVNGVETAERRFSVRRRGPAQIMVELEMGPQVRFCGFEARGKCAVAYGPLVMALDEAPAGAALDQVGLALGDGAPAGRLHAVASDGWPVIEAPALLIPLEAVYTEPLRRAGVRLVPVLLAGLKGNPGLERVIDGEDQPAYNLSKQPITLFPEYRVLLPYFWNPRLG